MPTTIVLGTPRFSDPPTGLPLWKEKPIEAKQGGPQIFTSPLLLAPPPIFRSSHGYAVVERKAHRSKAASKQMDESAFI